MCDPSHRLSACSARAFAPIAAAVIAAAAIAGPAASVLAQAGSPAAKSVVKITCRAGGKEWRGTGFAWNEPTKVVTALHVVAGCDAVDVFSEGTGKTTSAKVTNALVDSDLALLQLKETIGLSPLKTGNEAPPSKAYTIWGYPQNVRTMQGDELRFSKVLKPTSTLEDVMTAQEHKAAVGENGYPKLKTTILRIGSTIQPGHSGAPIFDPSGAVVGIGDGGLHEGIKSINWAIPTTSLQSLAKTPGTGPAARPRQAAQFSVEASPNAPVPSPIALAGDAKLRFVFSASLQDILKTASRDEVDGIKDLLADAAEDLKDMLEDEAEDDEETSAPARGGEPIPDLRKAILDIYTDPQTGATIAVPKGVKPRLDAETHMVTASFAKGRVTMYIQVVKTGGAAAMQQFETRLNALAEWKPDPEIKDDRFEEPGLLQVEKDRYSGDDVDDPDKTMFYSATVDRDSFLGTALVAAEKGGLSAKDQQSAYLMEICVELSGFTID